MGNAISTESDLMAENEQQKYRVTFKGEIESGQELVTVKERLAQLFKAPPERIEKLFTGKSVTLNHSLEYSAALEYITSIQETGILCEIEPMPPATTLEASPSPAEKSGSSSAIPVPPPKTSRPTKTAHAPSASSRLYTVGWILTASGLLILFTFYFLLILFTISTTYGFFEDNAFLLDDLPIGLGFLAYILPIVAGILLIAALLKPFFANPVRKKFSIPLSRKKEQALFVFVEKLCRSLGSKKPTNIEVDCNVRVQASYRRELISFLEDDLTLTVGLPVISEMTLSEFVCLLGHEFGHFTDKTGTRLYYIITAINSWFHHKVFEQDVIDQKIEIWIQTTGNIITRILLSIASFFVWVTRKILSIFMMAGQAMSTYYVRQMEFDADLSAVRLAGTKTFESSIHKLHLLSAASKDAYAQLKIQKKPTDNSLPEDFILLISTLLHQMTGEDISKIKANVLKTEPLLFSANPNDLERIEHAQRTNAPGSFQSDKPASSLFAGFAETARIASSRLYREALGLRFSQDSLIPTYEFLNLPAEAPDTQQPQSDFF